MNAKELCSMVDHTLLKQTATWPEIQNLCDEAIAYGTASVCIPPCYVAQAHQYVQGKMSHLYRGGISQRQYDAGFQGV